MPASPLVTLAGRFCRSIATVSAVLADCIPERLLAKMMISGSTTTKTRGTTSDGTMAARFRETSSRSFLAIARIRCQFMRAPPFLGAGG
ncbi:hypothetical protein D3C86_1700090 [compost metagenome]